MLKDGTIRCGKWQDNVPCGDWWTSHSLKKEPHHELRTMIPVVDQSSFEKATMRKLSTKIGCKLDKVAKTSKASSDDDEDEKMSASSPSDSDDIDGGKGLSKRTYYDRLLNETSDDEHKNMSASSPSDSEDNGGGEQLSKRRVDRLSYCTSPDMRSDRAQSS